MSYDLRIAVKVEGAKDLFAVIAIPEYNTPSYNLGLMFRACTGWNFEQDEFYKVSEVYPKIERGIYELTYNREKYLCLSPINYWMDIRYALNVLKYLKNCIDDIENPDSWVELNTVPKEYMYIKW